MVLTPIKGLCFLMPLHHIYLFLLPWLQNIRFKQRFYIKYNFRLKILTQYCFSEEIPNNTQLCNRHAGYDL